MKVVFVILSNDLKIEVVETLEVVQSRIDKIIDGYLPFADHLKPHLFVRGGKLPINEINLALCAECKGRVHVGDISFKLEKHLVKNS